MSGFLYYVPGVAPPSMETLDGIGFPHSHVACLPGCGVKTGPIDHPGHVFILRETFSTGHPTPGWYPEKQTWLECADEKFFIGRWNETPPTPSDLQNKKNINGQPIVLADGNKWTIPAIRNHADGTPQVESVLRLKSDGTLVNDAPAPQYVRMWGLVQKLYNDGNIANTPLSQEECFALIGDVLALNYRISVWELGALEIITTENIDKVFQAIIGIE